jgi:hypothetical protein
VTLAFARRALAAHETNIRHLSSGQIGIWSRDPDRRRYSKRMLISRAKRGRKRTRGVTGDAGCDDGRVLAVARPVCRQRGGPDAKGAHVRSKQPLMPTAYCLMPTAYCLNPAPERNPGGEPAATDANELLAVVN